MSSGKKRLILANREEALPFSQLARVLPGGPYTYETVLYWCLQGRRRIKHDPTSAVKMEYIDTPVGHASSIDAYWRFLEEFNR